MGVLPGALVSYCCPSGLQKALDGFLSGRAAAILVLFGAYQILDTWIARVSREEREALEARQAAILAAEKESRHVSH